MKQVEQSMPTANIAINKSRIKVYKKNSDMPTYYLQKGQEFQIELFNPTTDKILAKISLNNNPIAQGGLVLNPGQRVFLDRYIDVAKKFKFDTYEVANTSEVKEAIKENGDFKVEFFKEEQPRPILRFDNTPRRYFSDPYNHPYNQPVYGGPLIGTCDTGMAYGASITTTSLNTSDTNGVCLDALDFNPEAVKSSVSSSLRGASGQTKRRKVLKSKKSIETGRVEAGSNSEQKLQTVNYNFERTSFCTITYKMLPVSQKVNTVKDTKVAQYCVECGNKQKANNKFCPNCGNRV